MARAIAEPTKTKDAGTASTGGLPMPLNMPGGRQPCGGRVRCLVSNPDWAGG